MDIAEPLSTLKQLLELRLQCSLADHQFFLQDSIPVSSAGYWIPKSLSIIGKPNMIDRSTVAQW